MTLVHRVFPFIAWFKSYDLGQLRVDLVSGLTVALVLVPQSMAYAQLAGLPAYYGLYAAFLPPIVASLFGSSRQLATGPVAVVSLMTAAALEPLATAGSEAYVAYALLLALVVGVFQLSLGVLRLGLVVNFLSHPVVNGFSNAAALIIATSQLAKISVSTWRRRRTTTRPSTGWWRRPSLHPLADPRHGPAAFAIMIGLRRLNPRIPNVLVAVVATTALAWGVGFERDETVPPGAAPVAAVHQLVASFNEAVATKQTLETSAARAARAGCSWCSRSGRSAWAVTASVTWSASPRHRCRRPTPRWRPARCALCTDAPGCSTSASRRWGTGSHHCATSCAITAWCGPPAPPRSSPPVRSRPASRSRAASGGSRSATSRWTWAACSCKAAVPWSAPSRPGCRAFACRS